MRGDLLGGVALISMLSFGSVAQSAPSYRYCADYPWRGDVTCAYDTFEQCLATAGGGMGGSCRENPWWRPGQIAPARVRKAKRKNG